MDLSGEPKPEAASCVVEPSIDPRSIRDFMNAVQGHYLDGEPRYQEVILGLGDGESLIHHLKERKGGKKAHVIRRIAHDDPSLSRRAPHGAARPPLCRPGV